MLNSYSRCGVCTKWSAPWLDAWPFCRSVILGGVFDIFRTTFLKARLHPTDWYCEDDILNVLIFFFQRLYDDITTSCVCWIFWDTSHGNLVSGMYTGNQITHHWTVDALALNSSPPSAAYMRHWTGSALIHIMACRLIGVKPLSEPMLEYWKLAP